MNQRVTHLFSLRIDSRLWPFLWASATLNGEEIRWPARPRIFKREEGEQAQWSWREAKIEYKVKVKVKGFLSRNLQRFTWVNLALKSSSGFPSLLNPLQRCSGPRSRLQADMSELSCQSFFFFFCYFSSPYFLIQEYNEDQMILELGERKD